MLGESNQEVMHLLNHQTNILKNSDAEGKEIVLLLVNPHYYWQFLIEQQYLETETTFA